MSVEGAKRRGEEAANRATLGTSLWAVDRIRELKEENEQLRTLQKREADVYRKKVEENERLRTLIQKDYRPALSDAWELAEDRRDRIEAARSAIYASEALRTHPDIRPVLDALDPGPRTVKALKGEKP